MSRAGTLLNSMGRSVSPLQRRQQRLGWVFLLPTLAVLAVIGAYPLARTFWTSLTDARMASADAPRFIGLANYGELLARATFWEATRTTLLFTVISVALETLLGLGMALAVHARFRGRALVRAAILVPWALPTVVSARIWHHMLSETHGVVNDLLVTRLGLLPEKIAWTAEPGLALAAAVAVDVWKTTPFVALLVLAGLQMIPRELYEAASVDGAGPWRRFTTITLPLIRTPLAVAVLLRTLDALRVFDAVWVLTRGELGTEVLATFTYRQTIDFRKMGFGSASSMMIFLLSAMVALVFTAVARKRGRRGQDGTDTGDLG